METPLDRAHAAMTAAPEDDQARLRFFERLADAELFLLLVEEPAGRDLTPQIFATEEGSFALAFDREERLAAFVGGVAAMAAVSGRALAQMLSGQGLGLGLNLGAVASEILIPAEALGWLAETLAEAPREVEARAVEVRRPAGLPERLVEALTVKLTLAEGLADQAWLAAVTYDDTRRGHMLAFVGARPATHAALARAVQEALIFSGLEAGEIDVAFLAAADPLVSRLARVGLGFDLPKPAPPEAPAAPGSDPDRPPRLR